MSANDDVGANPSLNQSTDIGLSLAKLFRVRKNSHGGQKSDAIRNCEVLVCKDTSIPSQSYIVTQRVYE